MKLNHFIKINLMIFFDHSASKLDSSDLLSQLEKQLASNRKVSHRLMNISLEILEAFKNPFYQNESRSLDLTGKIFPLLDSFTPRHKYLRLIPIIENEDAKKGVLLFEISLENGFMFKDNKLTKLSGLEKILATQIKIIQKPLPQKEGEVYFTGTLFKYYKWPK